MFSKHWDKDREYWQAVESPCPVFDICDDWFGREHDEHYRRMVARCAVVTSSEGLAEIVSRETGKFATYIPEPWELPEGQIKEPSSDPLVLWFGHSSNLSTLHGLSGFRLLIVTNAVGKGIIPYSPENLRRALEFCDCVIIPQTKEWKSANRMVESLRAGRFVIASDIPSYRGFDQYLGDIQEGVEWVRANVGRITTRIISGQSAISSFHPDLIGERWLNFISAAVNGSIVDTSTLTTTVAETLTAT